MKETKKYWKGVEELNQDPHFVKNAENEFPEFVSVKENGDADQEDNSGTSRRDFLKLMGFSVAAASLAACEAPVKKVIPYINKPDDVDPGVPNYYATTLAKSGLYASLLVKTREGRPTFLEGNELSQVNKGGLSPQVMASILGLYDSSRLKNFAKKEGEEHVSISKSQADKEIIAALKKVNQAKGNIRIVSQTILSPSTKSVINNFAAKYADASVKHITYDPISATGILKANDGVVPGYAFDKADIIVGFNCDFLGTWISPMEFASSYAKNRKLAKGIKEDMSRHYQFETAMSVTGASADTRVKIKPSEEPFYLIALYNELASKSGQSQLKNDYKVPELAKVKELAGELIAKKGKSLVVSGSNDEAVQLIVKMINELLDANGNTIEERASLLRQGNDDAMLSFIEELTQGKVDAVIFYDANPAYDHPLASKISESLSKVSLSVSFSDRAEEETSSLCQFICPDYHPLESWGDAEPKQGILSLSQPTIAPIFDLKSKGFENRAAQESLMVWSDAENTNYYDYLRAFWKANYFTKQSEEIIFDNFWNKVIHDGVFTVSKSTSENVAEAAVIEESSEPVISGVVEDVVGEENSAIVNTVAAAVVSTKEFKFNAASSTSEALKKIKQFYKPSSKGLDLFLYESVSAGNGAQANNPWLYETPDAISKVTWDNYIAVSMSDANKPENAWMLPTGPEKNDAAVAKITLPGAGEVELPILVQPGQASGAISIALGYGRKKTGTLTASTSKSNKLKNALGEKAVGVDLYPFVAINHSTLQYSASGIQIEDKARRYKLAQTQTHHTIMARDTAGSDTIIQESTLKNYKNKSLSKLERTGVVTKMLETSEGAVRPNTIDVWAAPNRGEDGKLEEVKTHEYKNHHWGLVIDLNSCTGCGSCHIACQVENNIPVVGKDEVMRRRDMHWLRIDRYYSSDAPVEKTISGFKALEIPADNPKVTFQPMMCQHCDHAPCETVCPVAATTHSSEGLNQMTYNRCIGTRYCANNCPYKVRRFNWFNYSDNSDDNREIAHVNVALNDDLGKMVLNPDVTVRARGVMEKCSMCVQRIQAGKLKAKMEKRRVEDGDITTACQSVCPSESITFGDMNNPESRISKILDEENEDRKYHVLDELNVKPNVSYLSKIRNSEEA